MENIDHTTDLQTALAALETDKAAIVQRELAIEEESIRRDSIRYDALLSRCRDAKTALDQLDNEVQNSQIAFRQADNAYKSARWDTENHRSTYPPASSYPSIEALTEWQEELSELVGKQEAAETASGAAWAALGPLQHHRRVVSKAFGELTEQEREMREELQRRRTQVARRKPLLEDRRDPTADKATFVFGNEHSRSVAGRMPSASAAE